MGILFRPSRRSKYESHPEFMTHEGVVPTVLIILEVALELLDMMKPPEMSLCFMLPDMNKEERSGVSNLFSLEEVERGNRELVECIAKLTEQLRGFVRILKPYSTMCNDYCPVCRITRDRLSEYLSLELSCPSNPYTYLLSCPFFKEIAIGINHHLKTEEKRLRHLERVAKMFFNSDLVFLMTNRDIRGSSIPIMVYDPEKPKTPTEKQVAYYDHYCPSHRLNYVLRGLAAIFFVVLPKDIIE